MLDIPRSIYKYYTEQKRKRKHDGVGNWTFNVADRTITYNGHPDANVTAMDLYKEWLDWAEDHPGISEPVIFDMKGGEKYMCGKTK